MIKDHNQLSKAANKIRSAQDQQPYNIAKGVARKMKGYYSAEYFEREFGATNLKGDNPLGPWSHADIVNMTKKALTNPTLVASPGMAKAMVKTPRDRKHEVMPDIYFEDDRYPAYIDELVTRLESEAPQSKTVDGICDENAIPGSWRTLMSAPSKPMRPQGYPQLDNGTSDVKFSARHAEIFDKLVDTMMGDSWNPKNGYSISRISQSAFPDAEYDVEWKVEKFKTTALKLPTIMDLAQGGEFLYVAETYGVVFAYLISRRNQNDTIREDGSVKNRPAPTVGQVMGFENGQLQGGRDLSSESIFKRQRARVVYAGNGPLNYALSGCLQPMRDYYLSTYSFTWKHTGAEDLANKLRGWIPIGVDAKEFDKGFPLEAHERIQKRWSRMFKQPFLDACDLMWRAPAFAPSPVEDDPTQAAMFGDPFDLKTFIANRGLPSGISYNPDYGKIWGTAYILFMFDDMFGDVLEFGIDKILKGQHPAYGLLNMGDDALILVKTVELQRQIIAKLESGDASPYIQLEVDDHTTFLGWVIVKNGDGYHVYPNIQSMLMNFLCAEHPIGDPRAKNGHRNHWAIGVKTMPTIYGVCPAYEVVDRVWREVTAKHFGQTVQQMSYPYLEMSESILGTADHTLDEARFLEKPERRFYSIDESSLSSQVLDQVVRTISPDQIREHCSHLIQPEFLH